MSKSQHEADADGMTQNQNNAMSDDPADGGRNSFTARPESTPADKKPDQDEQNQATIEDLGREGLGIATKE